MDKRNETGSRDQAGDDISLAQWALVDEIRAGQWTSLDFPRIARQDFSLNGIEFVNTLFGLPTVSYLATLKQRAADEGVTPVLIMVDDEGDGCSATAAGRREFALAHRKWVDIAYELGCRAIRTNCRGPEAKDKILALDWAEESYRLLLDYARDSGIRILIENHGGLSNDPEWMTRLFQKIADPLLGSYPDWRSPGDEFDNYEYLEKMLPYAGGMSYRNQPDDELTRRMLALCRSKGYHGWYGIESGGREEIHKGIRLLREFLQSKP